MKFVTKFVIFSFGILFLLQFIRPAIPVKSYEAELDAPDAVKHVFEKDCYSCHSNQRQLAWFDEIVPAYWLVQRDILTARGHLNFSTLDAKPATLREASLYEAVNMMQLGAMPLARFRMLHPEARVTAEDLAILKAYLAPWKNLPEQQAAVAANSRGQQTARPKPEAEFNGLSLDQGYTNWKLLSFTDRGDNNTFRFILGNEVAMRATQSGKISPWPDGAKIAKLAWRKTRGQDGLIHPADFIQVELMEKGAQQYKNADGWGWGRWRGPDLKPYGKNARFVGECTSCHLPVRGDDSVYTLPITRAHVNGTEIVNNRASLPDNLPYQPLDWVPSTMYVDPAKQTMAMLFVNGAAQQQSADSVFALITWSQREDPHWFGARIPDKPRSVEFVEPGKAEQTGGYSRYAGTDLKLTPFKKGSVKERVRFILSLAKATLP